MIITRFLAVSSLRAFLGRVLPGATEADFAALEILIAADKFLTDSGAPHPAFVNWIAGIRDRDADGTVPVPAGPGPNPLPTAMEMAR